MKTAISIPDPIFISAENLAERLGMSRSELYANAVNEFIHEHKRDKIVSALNKVYSKEASLLDPKLGEMQFASLEDEQW